MVAGDGASTRSCAPPPRSRRIFLHEDMRDPDSIDLDAVKAELRIAESGADSTKG